MPCKPFHFLDMRKEILLRNHSDVSHTHFLDTSKVWRKGWDSNPRYLAVYSLSRGAPSTSRPPFQNKKPAGLGRVHGDISDT